ncbi:HCP-like protein, partial [Backusella circina FSU 941]
ALAWYRLSADKNNPSGLNNLGYMYHYGKSVPQDYQTAMDLYLRAAKLDKKRAFCHIGELLENGHGVEVDRYMALEWYRKYDPVSVEEKYPEALYWYKLSADKHYAKAENNIGMLYNYGKGVHTDYALAMEWYLKAAKKYSQDAFSNIGKLLEKGQGISENKYKALEWYSKYHGDIGFFYQNGYGVPRDYAVALEWYFRSARLFYNQSCLHIGNMLENGLGVPVHKYKALEWYRKWNNDSSEVKRLKSQGYHILKYEKGNREYVLKTYVLT